MTAEAPAAAALDVSCNVVAWMDERHAWRGALAPTEPGTYALVLADDYIRLRQQRDALLAELDRRNAKPVFTSEQLAMFAHLATEKAEREAALCYPADDPRIERAAQELMVVYYRQYTGAIAQGKGD